MGKFKRVMKEYQLFPTSMFRTKLNAYGGLNQKLEKYIYDLKEKNPQSEKRSNMLGWHSPDFSTKNEIVVEFINRISPFITEITNKVGLDLNYKGKFRWGWDNIWSIISPKYAYNIEHNHGTSILSLAYYVKVPKNMKGGEFYFKDPRIEGMSSPSLMHHIDFKSNPSKTTGGSIYEYSYEKLSYTQTAYQVPPEEGTLLIFPGWLTHGVYQSLTGGDRIVISANLSLYNT